MNKKTLLITVATGVAALSAFAWAFAPRPVEVEVARATRGNFQSTIEEDAKTRLRDRYVLSAPLAGRLARVQLREGDAVEAGQVLAVLTPMLPPLLDDRTLREQGARVDIARAQRELAKARASRAMVTLAQAHSDLKRSEQLAQQDFIAPTKLESDRLAMQAALKEQEAAIEQTHVAEHEVRQALAALSAVRGSSGGRGFELRSPVSGRVLKVHQASENTVALGTPMLELGDTRRLEVVAELLTADALAAKPGSPVLIERWGGPGTLQGRVRLIEPGAYTKVSALGVEEQRVEVLIDISSPPEQWSALGDGFRVGIRVITLAENDALKVPVSTVFPLPKEASASMGVFSVEGGRVRLVPVELVARNGEEAWISKGIAPATAVVVYPPGGLTDGQRVRIRSLVH